MLSPGSERKCQRGTFGVLRFDERACNRCTRIVIIYRRTSLGTLRFNRVVPTHRNQRTGFTAVALFNNDSPPAHATVNFLSHAN